MTSRISLIVAFMFVMLCAAVHAGDQYILPTNPPVAGASVFVDGTPVGTTDQNGKIVLTAGAGVHLLRVESGGESYTAQVPFDAELNALPPFNIGETTRDQKPPQSRQVDYRIDVNVEGAEVIVDGLPQRPTNSAGRTTVRVTAGQQHTVEVRKSGFDPQAQTIVPVAGGELKLSLQHSAEPLRQRVDIVLVALVILLIGSIVLLLIMLRRHRARTAVSPTSPLRVTPAASDQSIGHFDRYRLISTLGSGGVGTIYRAFDLVDKTPIALKVLDARWLSDPDMVRKFLAEGEALRSIKQHDAASAVVKCFRYGREHDALVGRPFIALELLEGETLQGRLDRDSVLDPLTAVAAAYQIASALVPVHGAGIVHRDLTPDNIFLKKGELLVGGARFSVPLVVLIDFGIARQELMSRLTLDGSIAGKPHYMSPEQCRGLTTDARSDLYSLGIILYSMAAGRLPFAGRDPFEVMRAQMSDEPPRLGTHIDQRYADLCERLLQKAAESRPQSAVAVAHELEQILLSIDASASINVLSFRTRRISS